MSAQSSITFTSIHTERLFGHIYFDELGNICTSDDWGAHSYGEWHLTLLLIEAESQGLDKSPFIVDMVGQVIAGRPGFGSDSGVP